MRSTAAASEPRGAKTQETADTHRFSSLAVGDFRTFLMGSFGSFLAQQIDFVARGYLAYTITNSATAIGMVQLAWGVGPLFLSLFTGALADRLDKRVLVLAAQSINCASAIVVAVLVATGRIEIWHLVASGLLQGIVFTVQMPARHSIIPELVGRVKLANAIGFNSMGMNLSRIMGPAIAGTLIAFTWFGMAGTYFLVALIWVVVMLTSMRLPPLPGRLSGTKEPILDTVTSGVKFLFGSRTLMLQMGLAFVPITLGLPYQALLPVFSEQVLALGPEGLGHLYAANGVGALGGAAIVAYIGGQKERKWVQLGLGAAFGVALVLFSFSRDYWTALVLLVLLGTCGQCFLTLNMALVTRNTPSEYYGRIMSIYLLTWAVLPLATFPIAAVVDNIGVSSTLTIGGSLVAASILGIAVLTWGVGRNAIGRTDSKSLF